MARGHLLFVCLRSNYQVYLILYLQKMFFFPQTFGAIIDHLGMGVSKQCHTFYRYLNQYRNLYS